MGRNKLAPQLSQGSAVALASGAHILMAVRSWRYGSSDTKAVSMAGAVGIGDDAGRARTERQRLALCVIRGTMRASLGHPVVLAAAEDSKEALSP
jgi:hypothetical protein